MFNLLGEKIGDHFGRSKTVGPEKLLLSGMRKSGTKKSFFGFRHKLEIYVGSDRNYTRNTTGNRFVEGLGRMF